MLALALPLVLAQAPFEGLTVSPKALVLDGVTVTKPGPTDDEFFTVPSLAKALQARRTRALTVRFDADVPFGLVRRVLMTLTERPNPQLVVQNGAGRLVWAWATPVSGAPLDVFIDEDTVRLRLAGDDRPSFPRGKPAAALLEELRQAKAGVVLVPDANDSILFGAVLTELEPLLSAGAKLQLSRVPSRQGPHFGPMQQFGMLGLVREGALDGGEAPSGFTGPIGSSRGLSTSRKPPRGTLSRDELKAGFAPHLPAIRACYDKALTRDGPEAGGLIKVSLLVGLSGTVSEVTVESAGPAISKALQDCVVDVVKRVKTARPSGGEVRVTYPFTFTPGG